MSQSTDRFTPTPGPYTLDPEGSGTLGSIVAPDGTQVGQASQILPVIQDITQESRKANGYLLAASWDLLKALEMYVSYRDSGMGGSSSKAAQRARAEMHDAIESAIARAKGER